MVTVILRYFDFMFIVCDAIIMTSTCRIQLIILRLPEDG